MSKIIVRPGEDVARAASERPLPDRQSTEMLTPGERRFRRKLDIFVVLLVAVTAMLLMLERAADERARAVDPQPTTSTAG